MNDHNGHVEAVDRDIFAYRRAMNAVELDPAKACLVVIDLQGSSCDETSGFNAAYRALGYGDVIDGLTERLNARVIPNTRLLLDAFRQMSSTIVFTTVGTVAGDYSDMPDRFHRSIRYWKSVGIEPPYAAKGTSGMNVIEALAPRPGEAVVAKSGYSGFTGTPLHQILNRNGVRQLVFCGVATEACVEATLRAGVDLGYDCILAEDACTSIKQEDHELALRPIGDFAMILSTSQLIEAFAQKKDFASNVGLASMESMG